MAIKKDWKQMYNDPTTPGVGDTLTEAKERGWKYYRNECKRHGKTVYCVLDNTCPMCVREQAVARRAKNPLYNRAREKYSEIKRRALAKGLEFDLTTDYIRTMLEETRVCPVLGIELMVGKEDWFDNSPSIDRIDSNKGYTLDNVIVISGRANRIKNNATVEELELILQWLKTNTKD